MEGLLIRDGSRADCPELRNLWQAAWQASYASLVGDAGVRAIMRNLDDTDFRGMLPGLDERLLVAILGGRIAGSAIFAEREGIVYLWGMYIHPSVQRHGIGTALLAQVAAHVSLSATVQASVLETSPWAETFYRRFGFVASEPCTVHFTADDPGKPGKVMAISTAMLRNCLHGGRPGSR